VLANRQLFLFQMRHALCKSQSNPVNVYVKGKRPIAI